VSTLRARLCRFRESYSFLLHLQVLQVTFCSRLSDLRLTFGGFRSDEDIDFLSAIPQFS
jgi:hypothetical protein